MFTTHQSVLAMLDGADVRRALWAAGALDVDDLPIRGELRGWPHHSQCTPAPHQRGRGWTKGPPPVSRRKE